MGFMSARSFRQIATNAGEAYLNKRQTMRDKIDELSEKASKRGGELQKKYNKYYDEEKAKKLYEAEYPDLIEDIAELQAEELIGVHPRCHDRNFLSAEWCQ